MTDASKAVVWDAVWLPWGAPYQITGPEALDARFPGALFLVNTRQAGVERTRPAKTALRQVEDIDHLSGHDAGRILFRGCIWT